MYNVLDMCPIPTYLLTSFSDLYSFYLFFSRIIALDIQFVPDDFDIITISVCFSGVDLLILVVVVVVVVVCFSWYQVLNRQSVEGRILC